jgi:hypothetical protein
MSLDAVFNGPPTSSTQPSGKATLGINASTGQLYYQSPSSDGWQQIAGGSGGGSGNFVSLAPTAIQTVTGPTEELILDNTNSGANPTLAIGAPLAAPINGGGLMLTGTPASTNASAIEIHNEFSTSLQLFVHTNTNFRAPEIAYYKSRGTQTAPTAILNQDNLAYPNQIFAYDGSSYGAGCTLEPRATENWSSTDHGCAWDFFVVTNGSTNQFRAVTVDNTGFVSINAGITPNARLSIGGGAGGNFQVNDAGTVNTPAIQITAAAGAPTSAGTAGTAGEIIYFGGALYFCSATGAAGAASWNSVNLTHV